LLVGKVPDRDRAERHWRPVLLEAWTVMSWSLSQTGTVPKGIGDCRGFSPIRLRRDPVPNRDRAERHWRPDEKRDEPIRDEHRSQTGTVPKGIGDLKVIPFR
jgi:hypothetical protein